VAAVEATTAAVAAVAATTTRRLWLVPYGRVNKRFEKKNNADNGGIVPASWPRGFVATRSDATLPVTATNVETKKQGKVHDERPNVRYGCVLFLR
jgi:hypothetical protein